MISASEDSPLIFQDNEFHEIVTRWTRKKGDWPMFEAATFEGKECPMEVINLYRWPRIGVIIRLDKKLEDYADQAAG